MAISRAQLAKELEPGLNALFGLEYDEYNNEFSEIFSVEDSERAFEEEVMIVGFGAGSGSTIAAAQKLGRNGWGCDINSECKKYWSDLE